jgi:1-acyl-sn-glycerol-3-phosphate acyltransferase
MRKFRPEIDHEAEYRRFLPMIERICRFALAGKKIDVRGADNFVRKGPSIIIGNHCGSYKDVAVLFRIASRPLFFNANQLLFTRPEFSALVRKHLHRHMGRTGLLLNFFLKPYFFLFVDYISANIARVGTIPVNLNGSKREAIEKCEDYMRRGRALVSLQGRGRVDPKGPNPYIRPFGHGTALIACHMLENDNLHVPVTPLAIFGSQWPWLIPGTIRIVIGEPLFARDYLGGSLEENVECLTKALADRVQSLFMTLIRS